MGNRNVRPDQGGKTSSRAKRMLLMSVGGLSFVLGSVGTLVPVLPTVPFYLLSAFCFARSSREMHRRFVNSALYRENVEPYLNGRGMPRRRKVRIMLLVTALAIPSIMASLGIPWLLLLLCTIWLVHAYVLLFRIKTAKENSSDARV